MKKNGSALFWNSTNVFRSFSHGGGCAWKIGTVVSFKTESNIGNALYYDRNSSDSRIRAPCLIRHGIRAWRLPHFSRSKFLMTPMSDSGFNVASLQRLFLRSTRTHHVSPNPRRINTLAHIPLKCRMRRIVCSRYCRCHIRLLRGPPLGNALVREKIAD